MKRRNLTTSIFSSDASDFLALALALAVIDKTAVVTYNETRIINHCTFLRKISSRPQGKKKKNNNNIPGYSYHASAQTAKKTGELQ